MKDHSFFMKIRLLSCLQKFHGNLTWYCTWFKEIFPTKIYSQYNNKCSSKIYKTLIFTALNSFSTTLLTLFSPNKSSIWKNVCWRKKVFFQVGLMLKSSMITEIFWSTIHAKLTHMKKQVVKSKKVNKVKGQWNCIFINLSNIH